MIRHIHRVLTTQPTLLLLSLILIRFTDGAYSQSVLPDDVQADILRAKIVKMAKGDVKGHQDFAGILSSIDEYKKLDVDVPPVILLVEAKAAHATSDSGRAVRALESYMIVADRKSTEYQQAVALYPDYQAAAEPARQRQRDTIRSQPLSCKAMEGNGNLLSTGNADAAFGFSFEPSLQLSNSLATNRSSLTFSWTISGMYGAGPHSVESAFVRLSLVPGIPFSRNQMIPFATIGSGGDKRVIQNGEDAVFNSMVSVRNPAAGKYCVIVEGYYGQSLRFWDYWILKGPLVIVP